MSDEAALQRAIVAALEKLGFRVIRMNSGKARGFSGRMMQLAPAGTPDLLVVHPYCWLEVKDEEPLSNAQRDWHSWARSNDVPVAVVRSVKEAVEFVLAQR